MTKNHDVFPFVRVGMTIIRPSEVIAIGLSESDNQATVFFRNGQALPCFAPPELVAEALGGFTDFDVKKD